MIQYPDYLPVPLRDSYGFEAVSPMVRSDLQSGRARQRRRYTSVPTMASVSWLMTDLQARMFEAWFEEVLISGSEWFEMPLKTPLGGLQNFACRFTDIYRGPTLVGVSLWRFTAELELRERPILPPGWITIAPDFIRYTDILDRVLNQEWPQA
ncbi:hypothetical protein V2S84_23080 [Azotobacter chroococcum]|nr:hypothetical protein [Azotobacter chroococcum]